MFKSLVIYYLYHLYYIIYIIYILDPIYLSIDYLDFCYVINFFKLCYLLLSQIYMCIYTYIIYFILTSLELAVSVVRKFSTIFNEWIVFTII